MAHRYKYREYVRANEFAKRKPEPLPERLPLEDGKTLVHAFVEGYEDVAFWRAILDRYENERVRFEISVPLRGDLAKGKKALMALVPQCSEQLILCMDSDFDYLFDGHTDQSRTINSCPFVFHTYAYATENYLCYAPSLHNVCVRATQNDTRIFDFEAFLTAYSRIIYPLFLWYAYSARLESQHVFTLLDFKSSVKLNYLEVENNGADTLAWLDRQVKKRLAILETRNAALASRLAAFSDELSDKEITPENVYLFMQGHTLMDNVVIVMLNAVCDKLKYMATERIGRSAKRGVALTNEQSNYKNSLHGIRESLLYNVNYRDCFLYRKLEGDIVRFLERIG